jgi:tryptophan halogenase
MQRAINRIVIVGGGTAGWMTAAYFAQLAKGAGLSLELVESEEIGIVGVGEATIPTILDFNRMMQLDEAEFMRATQATFKAGIQFVDWYRQGHSFTHPFGFYGVPMHGIHFHHFWLRHHLHGGTMDPGAFNLNVTACNEGRFGRALPGDRLPLPEMAYAYHFDAALYARTLRAHAEARGVKRTEGKIVQVLQNAESGFIEAVKLEDGRSVGGDFFIDCSGFRGLLIEQTLHAGYEDWSEWLPCDRAVAVPCERQASSTPYTRSTARDSGWQWRIPLQHRIGNGYVYCSRFVSDDEAASQLLAHLDGAALAAPRPLRFAAGRRKEVWKKNCVAVGLASGFLEPLESTSIHLIQSVAARILFMLPGAGIDQAVVDKFNAMTRNELEEIRDFLVLHYTATLREDTPFWRHCRAIEKPDSLRQRWEIYERTGNIVISPSDVFKEPSWFAVFRGQGVQAQAYHPFADIPPDGELQRRFDLIAGDVKKRVATFPLHDDYVQAYCAAPPMAPRPQSKAM